MNGWVRLCLGFWGFFLLLCIIPHNSLCGGRSLNCQSLCDKEKRKMEEWRYPRPLPLGKDASREQLCLLIDSTKFIIENMFQRDLLHISPPKQPVVIHLDKLRFKAFSINPSITNQPSFSSDESIGPLLQAALKNRRRRRSYWALLQLKRLAWMLL